MSYQQTRIKGCRFINKKAKQFVQGLNTKDAASLHNSVKINKNSSHFNQTVDHLNNEQFKKVAIQVQFLGYDKDYCMIFAIYGPKIDRKNKELLSFTLRRIIDESFYLQTKIKGQAKGFKKYCTDGITLIFFNNCSVKKRQKPPFSSKDIFEPMKIDDFKHEVIRELELKYLVKINDLFLVYPSLLTKSWNYLTSFGLENGFFDTYFTYAESIHDLAVHLGPLFECQRLDSGVISYDSSVTNKNWKILYSECQKTQSFNELASYEKMCELSSLDNLENMPQYEYKKYLKEYQMDQKMGTPLILTILMGHILQNHAKFEGIFRKIAEDKELVRFQNFIFGLEQKCGYSQLTIHQFSSRFKQQVDNFQVQTITSIFLAQIGFFKKILIQLEQPLLSSEVYAKICRSNIAEIESCPMNIDSDVQKVLQIFEGISNQKGQSISLTTATISANLQPIVRGKVKQRIAFFEQLNSQPDTKVSKIIKSVIPNVKPPNETKITFKKVSNCRKARLLAQEKTQKIEIFQFERMRQENPLEYQTLRLVLTFLRKISFEEKHNLMSASNLAICFNPCFFRKSNSYTKQMEISIRSQCQINMKLVKVLQRLIQSKDLGQI